MLKNREPDKRAIEGDIAEGEKRGYTLI